LSADDIHPAIELALILPGAGAGIPVLHPTGDALCAVVAGTVAVVMLPIDQAAE